MHANSDLIATHEVIKAMETSLGFSMAVFNDQPTVTLLVDHNGRIMDANRRAGEYFEVPRASLLGMSIKDLLQVDLPAHFNEQPETEMNFSIDTADSHFYWQALQVRDDNVKTPIYIVKGTDTTKLHKAYSAMDTMQREREILEAEMQKAQVIQSTLLPHQSLPAPFEMKSMYLTAAEASGDWFGFYHDKRHDMLNIYIGDVTGHGIASSLLTGAIFGSMYTTERLFDHTFGDLASSQEKRLMTLARTANDIIFLTSSNLAMSMFLLSIDLKTGKAYSLNAGHRLPFVYKKSEDKVILFNGGGEVLGVSESPEHHVVERVLEPGDVLFLYTDGIVENEGPDKKRIRSKQIKELIMDNHEDINQLEKQTRGLIQSTWQSMRGEDDVAVMMIRYGDQLATPLKKAE